ncbi:ABC transporter permease subunit [Isachenkonia alkalipeptolytica]|uniref:ABC transporter permease n=1 Tax=Isachenkonia alkalipeptolytica TaxID=2565777 RepID=A0AA43XIN8_9CLOT|nr:ABC transporter permease [Isachenkonia alkalipeptolytica]NBG87151.1 ABC transporter permease [Isachenkonia alkalipeptolytica]
MKLYNLVGNEILKLFMKKRLFVVLGILLILIGLFAYGEQYTRDRTEARVAEELGIEDVDDWREITNQQLRDLDRRLENPFIPEEGRASLEVRAEQLRYYLEEDINPTTFSAGQFMSNFMEQSIFLFLPLLIILLGADIVSKESTTGTIKLLMTRPVPRWKILTSKVLALMVLEMLVIFAMAGISLVIAYFTFGSLGFGEPVITGFRIVDGSLDTSNIQTVSLGLYNIMVYSLGYIVAFTIGKMALMVSVLVKSTPAAIGIMMSSLIGGTFLSFFIGDWELTRYLFNVNLQLTDFLSGNLQQVEGLSLGFSVAVLMAWALGSVIIAYGVFQYKDFMD